MPLSKDIGVYNRQKLVISSFSVDKEDLEKLCRIIQERLDAASIIELSEFKQGESTFEVYEEEKEILKDSFDVIVTISGKKGDSITGSIDDVFNSPNFPDEILSLFIDSELSLKNSHNHIHANSLGVYLDFNKPRIFDLSFMPDAGTPNESNIEVKGTDSTWVNGVFTELKEFIVDRSSKFSIVHSHSIYSILLWIIGFPISFWFCNKYSQIIESVSDNPFAINALFLYVFLFSLFV